MAELDDMSHTEYLNWRAWRAVERSSEKLAADTARARSRRR